MSQSDARCQPQVVDLCRACRIHISWPVTGLDNTSQAEVQIEGGPWLPLSIAADYSTVIGYFAGPAYPNPQLAVVIPQTSYTRVRIVTTTETLTFPGGFIRLVP